MATAISPPALLSLEEYLQTSFHPDCDFVEGHLEERNVGERDHNRTQILLGAWFLAHEAAWNIYVLPEQRTRVSFAKVRVPDLCLLRGDAPCEQVLITPPLLCVEIMSPEDRLPHVVHVMNDYALMGVPHLWIVDPHESVAYNYSNDGALRLVESRLSIPGTEIYVDLSAIFPKLVYSGVLAPG